MNVLTAELVMLTHHASATASEGRAAHGESANPMHPVNAVESVGSAVHVEHVMPTGHVSATGSVGMVAEPPRGPSDCSTGGHGDAPTDPAPVPAAPSAAILAALAAASTDVHEEADEEEVVAHPEEYRK